MGRQSKRCWADTQCCDWRRERNIRAHDVRRHGGRHSAFGCTLASQICNDTEKQNRTKNGTHLWWWKGVKGGMEESSDWSEVSCNDWRVFIITHGLRYVLSVHMVCNNRSCGHYSWQRHPLVQVPHRCPFKKLMTLYWFMETGIQVPAYQGYS